jgi:V/A-type H+-transporting ATPase subunit I
MSLRPAAANWFELLVLRDDLAPAIDALARSSRVELQSHGEASAPLLMPECREMLGEFDELRQHYARYWPSPLRHEADDRLEPHGMLADAMRRLRDWTADAREPVHRIETLTSEAGDLDILLSLLRDARPLPDLSMFESAGPMLRASAFQLPDDEWPRELPGNVIIRRAVTADHHYLLAVGLPDDVAALERQLTMRKARALTIPAGLPADVDEAIAQVERRVDAVEREIETAEAELEALHDKHDLADAIGDALFIDWYVDNVPDLSSTENFAWITGWTSDTGDDGLLLLLADSGVKAILRMQAPPPGFEPPLILKNPRWMRPFEVFTNMLGVPASSEVDPTRIVAIASPLIFGYMFGDIGQGAVLLIAGLVLARRFPALRLLIAGGAASIVFGFLFGSVFGREDLVPAYWLHPLEHPITVLLVPMAGGAVLLLLGMLLEALQAYWQQKGLNWLETGAGLVLCYLSALGALIEPALLWVALAGALWFVFGHAISAQGRRLAAIGSAAAELMEVALQLLVNTISFVRVGAFALAHAGLSVAVVGVAAAPSSVAASALVMVLGNLIVIGLEGLVVGIQTTRLVLFEFFVRFLRAEGRPFKPMTPPDSHPPDHRRRTT